MKRILASVVLVLSAALCLAQPRSISFAYDATAETYFDNVENDGGNEVFGESLTLFSARVTPEVGFKAVTGARREHPAHHKLMAGVNIMKNFGSRESIGQLFKEVTFYYDLRKQVSDKCELQINAGIFPRSAGKGRYSEAFLSDSLRFYDVNHEGILFGFNRPNAYFELGVDWLGQFGTNPSTREQFMVFSAGDGKVLPWMTLGYSGYMIHYANCLEVKGLVDNILVSGYMDMDFGKMVGIQRLSLTAAYLQAVQRDRKFTGTFTFPMGGEFTAEVRHWNVSLRNKTYVGYSLMPYYNNTDDGGIKYGNNLYMGDPYYRVAPGYAASMDGYVHNEDHPEGEYLAKGRPGVYDRIELAWEPKIADGLYFKVGARFHFNGGAGTKFGFSGCNQIIALRFRLEELINKNR